MRPDADILLAHRGTAYLLRCLALLPEADYGEQGHPLAALSRRLTLATIGYEARGFAEFAEKIRLADAAGSAASNDERAEEIALGSTLPARALRYLVEHSAVHLSVEWRDLPDELWHLSRRDAMGRSITPAETVWLRARSVWLAAVDLGNGSSFADFPPELIERLLAEGSIEPAGASRYARRTP